MNAEQYRALVQKLESINPSEKVNEAGYMAAPVGQQNAVADAQAASNTAAPQTDGTTGPAPADTPAVATQPANQIPTIEASTFSQAYAQAKKQGLKTFKWCGTYAVKDKVNPQPVKPQPVKPQTGGIQPAVFARPIQPGGGIANQNQADTLNLVAAGGMGA
jgi:hypothetical protein